MDDAVSMLLNVLFVVLSKTSKFNFNLFQIKELMKLKLNGS